jgi:hypothetical protein
MRRQSTKLMLAFFLLSGLSIFAAEFPAKVQGQWQLNVAESMELMKSNPKFQASQSEMISKHLTNMVGKMIITVSKSSVTMAMGELKQEIPVTIESATKDTVQTKFEVKGKPYDLTFKILKNKYLQLISSATDDMNSFAWEKK